MEVTMKVTIFEDGPILLDTEQPISVSAAGGDVEQKPGPVYLCRCGQSATKPFCDGTHRKVKFTGEPAELAIDE
jgi:CDGSH-type Zn-finger protein